MRMERLEVVASLVRLESARLEVFKSDEVVSDVHF